MTGDARLRPADPADVAAIVAVFRRSRSEAMPWLPTLHTSHEDLAFFGDQVAHQRSWVAERGARILGFAVAADGWLNHLYVHPEMQGRGVGTVLVDQVRAAFPGGVQLWVFKGNETARRFYAARGFVEVETTDGSGNEERMPDIRMLWPAEADVDAQSPISPRTA